MITDRAAIAWLAGVRTVINAVMHKYVVKAVASIRHSTTVVTRKIVVMVVSPVV